jgi:hypothetical protein
VWRFLGGRWLVYVDIVFKSGFIFEVELGWYREGKEEKLRT